MGQGLTEPPWHMHPASSFSRFCPSAQEWDSVGHPTAAPCTPYQPVPQGKKNRKTFKVLFGSDPVAQPAWSSRDLLPAAVEELPGLRGAVYPWLRPRGLGWAARGGSRAAAHHRQGAQWAQSAWRGSQGWPAPSGLC